MGRDRVYRAASLQAAGRQGGGQGESQDGMVNGGEMVRGV